MISMVSLSVLTITKRTQGGYLLQVMGLRGMSASYNACGTSASNTHP